MEDKSGVPIKVGNSVITIDYIGIGRVVAVHDDEDRITTLTPGGAVVKSSEGVSRYGFAAVIPDLGTTFASKRVFLST